MTTPEKNSLADKVLRGVVFLLILCAIGAAYFLLLTEVRPREPRWDLLEISLWGSVFQANMNLAWIKLFPKEGKNSKEEFKSLLMALLSLLMLYAYRYFKNGSPFMDAEGPLESLALMIFCIVVGSFVVDWLLPERDKKS